MRRPWLVYLLGVGLAIGFTIAYVTKVDHAAEARNQQRAREICGLIVVLDNAYQQTQPSTPLGQNIADEVHRYRQRLGC